jgi:hypothetical protein
VNPVTARLVTGIIYVYIMGIISQGYNDRPDLSSDIKKTANVKQKLISGHETQMGLDT